MSSLSKTFQISSSALAAERLKLQTISSNMANAQTTRTAEGGPYRRRIPVFEAAGVDPMAQGFDQDLQGVQVSEVAQSTAAPNLVYDPSHPDADGNGYVAYPAVNVLEEMVDLMTTARTYEANANVIDVTKAMAHSALEIGRS